MVTRSGPPNTSCQSLETTHSQVPTSTVGEVCDRGEMHPVIKQSAEREREGERGSVCVCVRVCQTRHLDTRFL